MRKASPPVIAAFEMCRPSVLLYLKTNPHITNRILRALVPISYDLAIAVLGRMCDEQILQRHGIGGGCRYVLATTSEVIPKSSFERSKS